MAGIRVITFFRSDVPRVATIIREQFDVLDEQDIGKALIEQQRIGYQSVHFIVRLSPSRFSLPEYREFRGLKAEIQLRTVLQHAWAEIQHDIEYKSGLVVPASIHQRFMELAGLIEIGDREFDAIQREHFAVATRPPADEVETPDTEAVPSSSDETGAAPPIDRVALRRYLDARLSPDGRMAEWSYDFAARIVAALGFSNTTQLDEAIADYDDDLISRLLYGSRLGQVGRFEAVLLAAMGDKFIERHPWNEADWFRERAARQLASLAARGIQVGTYDPLDE